MWRLSRIKPFLAFVVFFCLLSELVITPTYLFAENTEISADERTFLEKIQKDSFGYFEKYSNSKTGLTADSSAPGSPSSIAATGFACASFAIAQSHGWMGYGDAYKKISLILDTLETKAEGKNGFYYHFLDPATGARTWSSEASSIDTALLMAGLLLTGEYFKGSDLQKRIEKLYEKVDWAWMTNGSKLMSHGWKPRQEFLPYYWDMYSEHLILLALAMGSPTHPIPKEAWSEWNRFEDEYKGRKIIYSYTGSLFTYQYSQAFIDFRKLTDKGINYFENSKQATLANKEFALENLKEFPESYANGMWGLSASLGPDGYKAYGAPPGQGLEDGTIAPYAIASSIVFTPRESIDTLTLIYQLFESKIYGPYGFRDSFNLNRNWWATDYLGIDQGIVVVMLENFLNDGSVWKKFMKLEPIKRWVQFSKLESTQNSAELTS